MGVWPGVPGVRRFGLRCLTLAVLISAVASPGWATPRYGRPGTYAVDGSPIGVRAGAIDTRSGFDLLTANQAGAEGPSLSFLYNRGLGSFFPEQRMGLSSAYIVQAVAAGDFNADGRDDFAVAVDDVGVFSIRTTVLVLLNNAPNNAAVGTCPAFDLDGNGRRDDQRADRRRQQRAERLRGAGDLTLREGTVRYADRTRRCTSPLIAIVLVLCCSPALRARRPTRRPRRRPTRRPIRATDTDDGHRDRHGRRRPRPTRRPTPPPPTNTATATDHTRPTPRRRPTRRPTRRRRSTPRPTRRRRPTRRPTPPPDRHADATPRRDQHGDRDRHADQHRRHRRPTRRPTPHVHQHGDGDGHQHARRTPHLHRDADGDADQHAADRAHQPRLRQRPAGQHGEHHRDAGHRRPAGRRRRQRHHLRQHRAQPEHRQLRGEPGADADHLRRRRRHGGQPDHHPHPRARRAAQHRSDAGRAALHLHLRHPAQRLAQHVSAHRRRTTSRRIPTAST